MIAINDSLIIDTNNSFEDIDSNEDNSSTSSSNELDSNNIIVDPFIEITIMIMLLKKEQFPMYQKSHTEQMQQMMMPEDFKLLMNL